MRICDLQNQFKKYALYEKGLRPKGYISTRSSLKLLCEFAETGELNKLDRGVIRSFFYYGAEERLWKAQTYRNHWHCLKLYFQWCKENKYIRKNPIIDIEKPPRDKWLPRSISTDDAKKVMYQTYWHKWVYELERYRNQAIISTLLMSGLRLQELLNLEVFDVNLASESIFVRRGKGGKDRYVPIYQKLIPILKEYTRMRNKKCKPSKWFFTGVKSDKQLNQKDVRSICDKIGKECGVKFTPHMLRHTFAREMIDNDFNLYKLKEVMGHSDITTTQRYLAISTKGIKKSLGQVDLF